jgi:hypothetical protein
MKVTVIILLAKDIENRNDNNHVVLKKGRVTGAQVTAISTQQR